MEIYSQIFEEIKCEKANYWHHLSSMHPGHHSGSSCTTPQNLNKFEKISFCLGGNVWKAPLWELRWIFVQLSPFQNSTPFFFFGESCFQHKWIAQNYVILTQIFWKHHWSLFLSITMVMGLSTVMKDCYCIFIHVCLKILSLEFPSLVLLFFYTEGNEILLNYNLRWPEENIRTWKVCPDLSHPSTPACTGPSQAEQPWGVSFPIFVILR